ncbi:MAG TPA: pyridoxamine 5'-phosphate oxidase family protein [Candidatus Dormibacteraeota bacterium]
MDPRAEELLGRPLIGNLGFYGLDGFPRVVPVWHALVDGEIHVPSQPDLYKCRALRADPRATLTVSTPELPYRVASVTGRAVVDRFDEKARIELVGALARRFLGEEAGERYLAGWMKGGHPGPGDLIRIPCERVRFTDV